MLVSRRVGIYIYIYNMYIYIYIYYIYICICNHLYIYVHMELIQMEKHPEPWSHLVSGDCQGTTRLITDRMMKPIFDLEDAHVFIAAK